MIGKMKILTWNINGIRAAKISLQKLFNLLDADIICLQETKITRDQLDEASCIVEGFNSYFSFSKVRSGYSGVATFVRNSATPVRAEEGLSGRLTTSDETDYIGCYGNQSEFDDEELQALDNEGRAIITQHTVRDQNGVEEYIAVINVYCPRADPEREDRKSFKLRFYKLLRERAEAILKEGSHVIILGDVNTSHKRIDNCDPGEDFDEHPGRRWLDELLWQPDMPIEPPSNDHSFNSSTDSLYPKGHKFVDSFRHFHPDRIGAYTCWSTVTGARATNYGTRIDYIFGDHDLVMQAFTDCEVMQDVEGSDHCPVKATLKWDVTPAAKCPSLCTKYMPEFVGTQKKLSSFFTRVSCKKESDQMPSSQESNDSGICTAKGENQAGDLDQTSCTESVSKYFSMTKTDEIKSEPQLIINSLKRTKSDTNQPSKRLKTNTDKKAGMSKQGSLLSFFGKSQTNKETISATESSSNTTSKCSNAEKEGKTKGLFALSQLKAVPDKSGGKTDFKAESGKKEVVSSWKQLLKGPPTAPLCKGHSEPCLLRTVKKEESFNKGRQFWVCNRPEGHKTNVEARCDTFIWVDKKKK